MFDLFALLTLLLSLMAPTDVGMGTSDADGTDDPGIVTTMTDGSPQPPGRR